MKKLLAFLCLSGFFCVQIAYLEAQAGANPFPGRNWEQGFIDEAFAEMERVFAEIETEPTPEHLYFLGRAVAANILATFEPYTGNPELTDYLNFICQALLVSVPQIQFFDDAYVLLLDSSELNAFTSPGGHIFITKGLVGVTRSEDELAAIIAHELAHIKLKHASSLIAEMGFAADVAAMANRAADFTGRDSPAVQRLMSLRDSVSVVIDTLMRNGYSQFQEFEADEEALVLLALSGYYPRALVQVLEILQKIPNSENLSLNTTHPSPSERIANIERILAGRQFRDTSSYRAYRFISSVFGD